MGEILIINEKAIRKNATHGWVAYVSMIVITCTIFLLWHFKNGVIPNDDAGDYFKTALQVYHQFTNFGWFKGLKAMYFVRGWRPIFFPVMALPFVAICGGKILCSVSMTLIFYYVIMLSYLYVLAKDIVSPWKAALCGIWVGTLHWLTPSVFFFMSEIPLIACSIAAVYHFKKSDFFSSWKHTLIGAIWLALAFMIRPVEAAFAFLVPGLIWVLLACQKKHIHWCDVLISAITLLGGVSVLLARFGPMNNEWAYGLIISVALFPFIISFILSLKNKALISPVFILSFGVFNALSFLWWVPKIKEFHYWIKMTTGAIGVYHFDQGQMSFFPAVVAFFKGIGGYPLVVMFLLFLIGLLLSWREAKSILNQYVKYFFIMVGFIVLPIFMLTLTTDITFRRAYIGFILLHLIQTAFALHPKIIFNKLRMLLVGLLIVIQAGTISMYTFNLYPPLRHQSERYLGSVRFPLEGRDPSMQTIEALEKAGLNHKKGCVFTLSLHHQPSRPFDTSGLLLAAEARENKMDFWFPDLFDGLEEGYAWMHRDCNFAILDTDQSHFNRPKPSPYEQMTVDLIEREKRGELESVGLTKIGDFEVTTIETANYQSQKKKILLFDISK